MIAFQGTVAAQDDPPPFPFPITKFNCEEDPGVIGQAEMPDGCVLVEGVSMTVTDADGNVLGDCVTDANGGCIVDIAVPGDGVVLVEEDVSTAPSGYTPRENPVEVTIQNEFSEAKLVNIKDTVKLPDTGSGTVATSSPRSDGIAGTLTVVATLLALGGLLVALPREHRERS